MVYLKKNIILAHQCNIIKSPGEQYPFVKMMEFMSGTLKVVLWVSKSMFIIKNLLHHNFVDPLQI